MKAILCHAFEGPPAMKVGEAPAPVTGPDEVRIAVHAASVNYIDLLIARGLYQFRPDLPYVVGAEGAGEVIDIGADVTHVAPGDRVAAFHLVGAFAEEMVAKHWRTVALPDAVPFETGAATLHNYVTAAYALRHRGRLETGETLLVHGATGGVGLAAVELGRLWGARVIAGVGSDEKAALARDYGAAEVINYTTESIRDRIGELTEGRGVDVVFDPVGGDVFDQSLRCIAWDGRILVIGFTSGRISAPPISRPLLKSASIVGVNTGGWPEQDPAGFQKRAHELMAEAAAGRIRPKIDRVLPLDRFGEAMAALEDRTALGRMVLSAR